MVTRNRILFAGFIGLIAMGAGYGLYQWRQPRLKEPSAEVLAKLAEQSNQISGWLQHIDMSERVLTLRRKKLRPFMPKREQILVLDTTTLFLGEKKITLDDLKQGMPVVIHYRGDKIENGRYVAEKIVVETK